MFNLICHRGASADISTIKLFKSFMMTLCNDDLSLIILPYQVAKQHYSSLTNIKQIQSIDEPRLHHSSSPTNKKKQYTLSGYLHISTTLSFHDIFKIPSIN
jgi:hypothetical protein